MGKKSAKINILYLVGMVLTAIGLFLPLTASKTFGANGMSAWDSLSGNSSVLKIATILILIGVIAGIVFCFVAIKGAPMKLISWIVALVGVLYVVIKNLTASDTAKFISKHANKIMGTKPSFGLILILVGLILALVGMLMNKDM